MSSRQRRQILLKRKKRDEIFRNHKHHTAYIYVCLFKQGDKKLIFPREIQNKDNYKNLPSLFLINNKRLLE